LRASINGSLAYSELSAQAIQMGLQKVAITGSKYLSETAMGSRISLVSEIEFFTDDSLIRCPRLMFLAVLQSVYFVMP